MSATRCPLCNGSMRFSVQYERAWVCVDCWDALCGREPGTTRQEREHQEDLAERRERSRRAHPGHGPS